MAKPKKKKVNAKNKEKKKQHSREYKDGLFRIIFRSKKELLELYNAVNNTDYKKAEDLEITTLDGAIGVKMKNDTSFILGATMNLYEHQSAKNPNMPLRGVFYLSTLYREYINKNGLDVYGSKQLMLPLPQFIVFYNGSKEEPDRIVLHLSDAFFQAGSGIAPCLDCSATMLNINYGHNKQLMEKCETLRGYSLFVSRVRAYVENGLELDEAVELVTDICIEEGVLAEILRKYRNEVKDTMIIEYDDELHKRSEERYRQEELAEARAKAETEGREKGRAEAVLVLLEDKGKISAELNTAIMECTDMEILKRWLKMAGKVKTIEEFECDM